MRRYFDDNDTKVSSRPGLVYPNPEDCPSSIAEAVYDIRYSKSDVRTHLYIKNFWGTADYLIFAVGDVYEANGWDFDRKAKKVFRNIFRGQFPES